MNDMDWKSRYHQALESLENEARAARRIEYRLREALSRLAVAAIGHDVGVDEDLGSLREALRAGEPVDSIHSLVGEVSERVRQLREPSGGEAPAPRLRESMLRVLELIEGSVPDAEALQTLQAQAREASLHELAGLHPELAHQVAAVLEQRRRPGLLGRLFSVGAQDSGEAVDRWGNAAPGSEPVAADPQAEGAAGPEQPNEVLGRVVASALSEPELPESMREELRHLRREARPERLGEAMARLLGSAPADPPDPVPTAAADRESAQASPERSGKPEWRSPSQGGELGGPDGDVPDPGAPDADPAIAEAVTGRIGEALQRLAATLEDSEEAERVRKELGAAPAPERLPELIVALSGAIQAHRETLEGEKQALRDFIQELLGRIGKLESSLQQARGGDQEYDSRAEDMDSRIQEGLSGIGRELQEAEDLARLRELMRRRLDELERRYQERRQMESRHRARAAENLNRMNDQIQSLQKEVRDLRGRLSEARADSRLDPLTRLPNRRAYQERLRYEAARFERFGRPLSLALVDIDDFKSLNDEFGHRVGDRTLARLARVLGQGLRESDFLARYGGEEFILLLPETGPDEARDVLERQRRRVAETHFDEAGVRLRVTVSAGIASFAAGDGVEAVFERADAALYRAKEAGRNCCMGEDEGEAGIAE